jgi:tryptophan synthase alpha chain
MSRLSTTFLALQKQHKKAFIPFITAGDSGLENSLKLMFTLVDNGADVLELGVPFSDPGADGLTIQHAHERAVAGGITLKNVLDLVKQFRKIDQNTPVVLMGYLNPIEAMGRENNYEKFANSASESGVDGVLIVDMPPEEADDLHQKLQQKNIDLIFLVAPTTNQSRLEMINKVASGFIYFVSLKGVTGAGNIDIHLVKTQLAIIKKTIQLPIAVGFGINDATTAQAVAQVSDGVIVGSAIVKLVAQYQMQHDKMHQEIGHFVKGITSAIN